MTCYGNLYLYVDTLNCAKAYFCFAERTRHATLCTNTLCVVSTSGCSRDSLARYLLDGYVCTKIRVDTSILHMQMNIEHTTSPSFGCR